MLVEIVGFTDAVFNEAGGDAILEDGIQVSGEKVNDVVGFLVFGEVLGDGPEERAASGGLVSGDEDFESGG